MLIYPSLLPLVDRTHRLNEEIASVEPYVDGIHYDLMDGKFVSPTTPFTAALLKKLKTKLPVEVHLMVKDPENYIPAFIAAGCSYLSFHWEAFLSSPASRIDLNNSVSKNLQTLRSAKIKAGLALNPETDAKVIDPFMSELDYVLIMSVQPGLGGQKFMPGVLEKIRHLKSQKPDLMLIIDGGINDQTARDAKRAGVDILVSGSYIFDAPDRKEAIQKLRQ